MKASRIILACLFVLGLIALACNLPPRLVNGEQISEVNLRETLEAQGIPPTQAAATAAALVAELSATLTPMPAEQPVALSDPFFGLSTSPVDNPLAGAAGTPAIFNYQALPGDTLQAVAARFGVVPEQVQSTSPIPPAGYIPAGQVLLIPNQLGELPYPGALLPDSEVIYSPSAVDFDVFDAIQRAGGFLSSYSETVDGNALSGAQIVQRVAAEASVNPRLLLAFLEYRSGWVLGQPDPDRPLEYPLGYRVPGQTGLYLELVIVASQINRGYYDWRQGVSVELEFSDGKAFRVHPALNPGTVALQRLFGQFYSQADWQSALYTGDAFLGLYEQMFGDPWQRATAFEPLIPEGLAQPELALPFLPGERWSLTGGPHPAWNFGSPRGALDFAPVTGEPACAVSRAWATAPASGAVVRAANNVLALDLDGDGFEQTGWVVVYVHLAQEGLIAAGSSVNLDDPLGHPSCERGQSTGTHVHITRKYNGEWLPADGPVPLVLSGWQVQAGERNYQGELVKGDQTVSANPGGNRSSIIVR